MSYHHHHSSPPIAGPASSPLTGTDITYYSPLFTRQAGQSSRAVGKQPVRDESLTPTGPPMPRLANDDDPDHVNFRSRYFEIVQYPNGVDGIENALQIVEDHMKDSTSRKHFKTAVPLDTSGNIKMHFDSLQEACDAGKYLCDQGFAVQYITQVEFARAKFQGLESINLREGEAQVTIRTTPAAPQAANELSNTVYSICDAYGLVRHVIHTQTLPVTSSGLEQLDFVFRIEFDSVDAAIRLVQSLPLKPFTVDSPNHFSWSVHHCRAPAHGSPENTPSRRSLRQPAPLNLDYRGRGEQHNQVRRDRIVNGLDIRTTIMLRNIPNKMDYQGLKQLLDEHCFGLYDFVYLRIDFKTGHNVGYAFINFVDAASILQLLDNIAGYRWFGFASQKSAEISYATIQGKEALIMKFRNSSVMTEADHVQPRVFYSTLDLSSYKHPHHLLGAFHILGTVADFPEPDNYSKLDRSIAGARNAGLFPPNSAGHAAFDSRARTGMYDNGNPREQIRQIRFVDDAFQRAIEYVYFFVNGFRHAPYESIPRGFIDGYLRNYLAPRLGTGNGYGQAAGVIGQPSNGSTAYAPAMIPFSDNTANGLN